MLHLVPQRTIHSIAAAFAAAMVFLSAPIFAADPPRVQVIEGTSGGGPQQQAINKNLLDRIQRLEQSTNNQSLVDTISRIDTLVQEMQTLLGRVEVLGHDIEQLKTTQRDQYLDIDTRLRRLETGGAGAAGGSAAAAASSAAEIDDLRKRQRELYLDIECR